MVKSQKTWNPDVNLSCKVHRDRKSDQNGFYGPLGSCSYSCFCSGCQSSCSKLSLTTPTTTTTPHSCCLLPVHITTTPNITSMSPNQTQPLTFPFKIENTRPQQQIILNFNKQPSHSNKISLHSTPSSSTTSFNKHSRSPCKQSTSQFNTKPI